MLHMPILQRIDENILKEHHLEGFYYSKIENLPSLKRAWLNTWAHNEVLLILAKSIQSKFPEVTFLKGISLLEDIYEDLGSRFMSDIDILVPINHLKDIENYLSLSGFVQIKNSKWYGNDFKIEYNKVENGREINVELHSRLFFHDQKNTWNYQVSNLKKLSIEDNLVHIIGHCGFSHNFQKLYWLVDIYLYLHKYEHEIDMDFLLEKIKELKLKRVFEATLYILIRDFGLSYKFKRYQGNSSFHFLLSKEFLMDPNQSGLNHYFVKHLIRDSIYESFKYDFFWMQNIIKTHFMRFLKK